MVTMGIFPFKEKFPWQSRELNPGPHQIVHAFILHSPELPQQF
jgi:hypothetical protein